MPPDLIRAVEPATEPQDFVSLPKEQPQEAEVLPPVLPSDMQQAKAEAAATESSAPTAPTAKSKTEYKGRNFKMNLGQTNGVITIDGVPLSELTTEELEMTKRVYGEVLKQHLNEKPKDTQTRQHDIWEHKKELYEDTLRVVEDNLRTKSQTEGKISPDSSAPLDASATSIPVSAPTAAPTATATATAKKPSSGTVYGGASFSDDDTDDLLAPATPQEREAERKRIESTIQKELADRRATGRSVGDSSYSTSGSRNTGSGRENYAASKQLMIAGSPVSPGTPLTQEQIGAIHLMTTMGESNIKRLPDFVLLHLIPHPMIFAFFGLLV